MQFQSFSEMLSMGGYGVYVWSSFGVSLFAMGLILFHSMRRTDKLKQQYQQQLAREEKLDRARQMEGTL